LFLSLPLFEVCVCWWSYQQHSTSFLPSLGVLCGWWAMVHSKRHWCVYCERLENLKRF
jgi:hypothetical protein